MMLWRVMKWVAAFLGLLLVLSCAGGPFDVIAMALSYVAFGWIGFLWRVIPQITINWEGVATALGSLFAVVVGAHWFLRWLCASMARAENVAGVAWRPAWTVALIAAVMVMFVSGICVVGTAHQTAWLVTSKKPLAGYGRAHEGAYRNQSNNNLKLIGLGLQNYDQVVGSLPPGASLDGFGRPLHSWQTRLLPYVEAMPLYRRINLSVPWDTDENQGPFSMQVPVYMHPKAALKPDERGYARSGYAGNAYVLSGTKSWPLTEMADGVSKTILCGEAVTAARPWGDPVNWRDPAKGVAERADGFGGAFSGVTQFVFADGHVSELSNNIDPAVFRALCTPRSGEAIADNDY